MNGAVLRRTGDSRASPISGQIASVTGIPGAPRPLMPTKRTWGSTTGRPHKRAGCLNDPRARHPAIRKLPLPDRRTFDSASIDVYAGWRRFTYSDRLGGTYQDAGGILIGARVLLTAGECAILLPAPRLPAIRGRTDGIGARPVVPRRHRLQVRFTGREHPQPHRIRGDTRHCDRARARRAIRSDRATCPQGGHPHQPGGTDACWIGTLVVGG